MFNEILNHIKRYIFYDIVILIILVIISKISIELIHDIKENKRLEKDYSNYDSLIKKIYNDNPSIFIFNEEGIATIMMTDLIEQTNIMFSVPQTKELDECVGYLIIEKEDFKIDYNHICDMVDY